MSGLDTFWMGEKTVEVLASAAGQIELCQNVVAHTCSADSCERPGKEFAVKGDQLASLVDPPEICGKPAQFGPDSAGGLDFEVAFELG